MSKEYLPIQVDPVRFAEMAVDLHGKLLLKDLPRIAPSLFVAEGEVDASMHFDIDRQKIRYVTGHVQATLTLQCQRCMEPFTHEISADFNDAIVSSEEEAKKLPAHYDAVMMQEGNLNVHDMIEDELLINLPIVFMHDPENCKVHLPVMVLGDKDALAKAEKENPFKVIESLKVKPKQE